jgi:hypothetical protein
MSHHTFAALDAPLSTDALLAEGVHALLGPALRPQIWIFLLDEESRLLSPVMPCDDFPERPSASDASRFGRFLAAVVAQTGAASAAVVVERPGGPWLTDRDRTLLRMLHDGCLAADAPVRAMLLSHRRGVSWVARDDYGF